MKKRLMALFMAVVLMMSLAPAAFAADGETDIPAEAAEVAAPVEEVPAEEVTEAVEEVPAEGPTRAANFLGTAGETVLSCPVGSSVTGSDILQAYGISGEITSLASDSEAVEVVVNEDGSFDVKINGVFADAKLTFTVNGEEIEIPIHDPTEVATEDALKSAISSAGSSTETPCEIQLTDNITLNGNGGITIAAGTNVVIDLNGYTLKNAVNENKASQVILNNGTLTIKDTSVAQTGKIQNDVAEGTAAGEWWSTPQYNYATNVINNQGNLTIESGTLEQTASGSICYAVDNNSNVHDAVLTINGGLLQSVTTVIRQFCQPAGINEVTINGGTVEGSTGDWIQLPGGTDARTASLTITDGTLSGKGYAFYDYSYGNPFTNVDYEVNGGEIKGEVFSYGADMTINDGIFTDDVFVYKNKNGYDNTVEINGGFFGGDVSVYDYRGGNSAYYGEALKAGYFKEWYDGNYYYDWCYETIEPKVALENYEPETMEEYPYIVGEPVNVTFVNWDGTELFYDVMAKGHPLYYPGDITPTRPADANYTYEFIGWDKALTDALTEDTVFTARFKAVPINTGSGETATKKDVITIPVSSEEDVLHYQGKVSGSEVEVIIPKEEEITEIIAATDPSAPVVVDCSNLDTAIDKVTLPETIIKAVNDNSDSVAGIEVKFSTGSVTLDTNTLASDDVVNAVSITLVLEETEMKKAQDAVRTDTVVQTEVGSKPTVIAVVDSYMIINQAVVRTLNHGKAMISIQEDLIPDTGFKVFAMDANGNLVLLEYEIVDGYIRFVVDELQTYIFVK